MGSTGLHRKDSRGRLYIIVNYTTRNQMITQDFASAAAARSIRFIDQ